MKKMMRTSLLMLFSAFFAGNVCAESHVGQPDGEHRTYLKDLSRSQEYKNHQSWVKDFKNTGEYQSANGYLKDLKNSEQGKAAQRDIDAQKAGIHPPDNANDSETDVTVADVATGTPPDACKTAMCMMGEVTGNGGGPDCRNPIKTFFSINGFKKHHRFSPGKTFDMRKAFLGECPDLTKEYQDKILSRFGRVRG